MFNEILKKAQEQFREKRQTKDRGKGTSTAGYSQAKKLKS